MVLRFHVYSKATRHRGCQTVAMYVEPTRLVSTEHVVRLSTSPVSYKHARTLGPKLASQPCPAQVQARRSDNEQALCRARSSTACRRPSVNQHLPSRLKHPPSIWGRASPCRKREQPRWDSTISWSCGRSPSTETPQHVIAQNVPCEGTSCVRSSCHARTAVHQLVIMCEKSTQTSSCLDGGSQAESTHVCQLSERQTVNQESAALQNSKPDVQQGCYCCCPNPRGMAVAGSCLASNQPASPRPAWRCPSLKPGWHRTSQAPRRAGSNRPCRQVSMCNPSSYSGMLPASTCEYLGMHAGSMHC